MEIKVQRGEIIWVMYRSADGTPMFVITSKPSRDSYTLHEVAADGSLTKLGKSTNPDELAEKFDVLDKIGKTVDNHGKS